MIEIKAYQCEFCYKKVLKTRSGMLAHEKKCFWNPAIKACMTCEHKEDRDRKINIDGRNYRQEYAYCTKFNRELKKGTLKINCKHWELREPEEWEE